MQLWSSRQVLACEYPFILDLRMIEGRPHFTPANKMFFRASINDNMTESHKKAVLLQEILSRTELQRR
jgi:hypothetical protein